MIAFRPLLRQPRSKTFVFCWSAISGSATCMTKHYTVLQLLSMLRSLLQIQTNPTPPTSLPVQETTSRQMDLYHQSQQMMPPPQQHLWDLLSQQQQQHHSKMPHSCMPTSWHNTTSIEQCMGFHLSHGVMICRAPQLLGLRSAIGSTAHMVKTCMLRQ